MVGRRCGLKLGRMRGAQGVEGRGIRMEDKEGRRGGVEGVEGPGFRVGRRGAHGRRGSTSEGHTVTGDGLACSREDAQSRAGAQARAGQDA